MRERTLVDDMFYDIIGHLKDMKGLLREERYDDAFLYASRCVKQWELTQEGYDRRMSCDPLFFQKLRPYTPKPLGLDPM